MLKRLTVVLCLLLACAACSSSFDDGMLAQADAEFAKGNYLRAESLYERYLEANPQGAQRWRAWDKLADIAINVVGDLHKAATILEAAHLEYSDDAGRAADVLWRLARVYTDLRDWERASETWNRLIDNYDLPKERLWQVYWNLGKIHQFQGRYAMAKDSMLSCMESAPDQPSRSQCMYELAQAYSFLKNREQAESWLEQLLALDKADPELKALATYLLSEQAEADGDIPRARELLESIRTTYPNPKVVESRLKHLGK